MVTVTVMVYPDARKEAIKKTDEHEFQIFVKEPAQRNMANTRMRELIAHEYGVAVGAVSIATGQRSPKKRLIIK